MKIDKMLQKECIKLVKDTAKEFGYKTISNSIYKIYDDCLVYADFLIVDRARFVYGIYIKKISFDDSFWKIMDMEENFKKSFSLRVNGAFVAPGVEVYDDIIELSEDIHKISSEFVNIVESKGRAFYEKNNIINYILSHNDILYHNTLQCLAYIDINDIPSAVEIARRQVEDGDSGGFINGDKGFFERLVTYYSA